MLRPTQDFVEDDCGANDRGSVNMAANVVASGREPELAGHALQPAERPAPLYRRRSAAVKLTNGAVESLLDMGVDFVDRLCQLTDTRLGAGRTSSRTSMDETMRRLLSGSSTV